VTDDPVGETYWKVSNGIRLTGMPAFFGSLTDEQLCHVSQLLAKCEEAADRSSRLCGRLAGCAVMPAPDECKMTRCGQVTRYGRSHALSVRKSGIRETPSVTSLRSRLEAASAHMQWATEGRSCTDETT
jgi:hypothetical protein